MTQNTKIEWCDHTFNPWWGCTKVSPGCTNCYAETLDRRTGGGHWGPTADRRLVKDWSGPRRWDRKAALAASAWQRGAETVGGGDEQALIDQRFIKPRRPRVFCASMADVFDDHPSILPEWRDRLWDLIRETRHLDWLLLTKRPENIATMLPPDWGAGWDNVWLGASVEDQTTADERIPHLLDLPSARRFVSCEPLLGPVDLGKPIAGLPRNYWNYWIENFSPIDWVIVGGESGPKARPMHPDWVRGLRDQCAVAGTAFFFKGWGEWIEYNAVPFPVKKMPTSRWVLWDGRLHERGRKICPDDNAELMCRVGKVAAGRLLDGREWMEVPE